MRGRRKRKRRRKIEDRRGGREVGREDGREGGQRRMEGGYLEGVLVPDIVAPTQALLPLMPVVLLTGEVGCYLSVSQQPGVPSPRS